MKKHNRERCYHWLAALQSIVGIGCASMLLGGTKTVGHSALWIVVFAFTWAGNLCFWREKDRRLQLCFGVLGTLFSLCCALGLRLDTAQQTGWGALVLCVVAALGFGTAAAEGAIWFLRKLSLLKTPIKLSEGKAFRLTFVVLLLCWMPVLVAFFPGIDGYDVDGQYYQILSGNYSMQHPLLHTLFLQVCIHIGNLLWNNPSYGFGISTAVQAVIVALSMAYAMSWLSRIRCPRVIWLVLLACFALSPQNSIMVVSATKDVIFAGGMLVLTVEFIRFLTEPERERSPRVWIMDILLIVLVALLRNNAVYGFVLVLMVTWTFWRRKLGKRVLTLLAAGVLCSFVCSGGLQTALNATGTSVREMLGVPVQQLARVYSLHGLEDPVGYEIREIMPFVEDYTPERADAVKRQAKVIPGDRLWRFVKLWGRELFHYPIEYIDAFLFNTKGYWWLNDLSYTTTYPGSGCMVLWHNETTTLVMENFWPEVKDVCKWLFEGNNYERFPVLWPLLQPALYTWLLGLVMAAACWKKDKALLWVSAIHIAYFCTLLLGLCVLIRFQYALMLCAPVMLGYLFSQKRTSAPATAREETLIQ